MTSAELITEVSWLFVRLRSFCAPKMFSPDVTLSHKMDNNSSFACPILLGFVSSYRSPYHIYKKCFLKDSD